MHVCIIHPSIDAWFGTNPESINRSPQLLHLHVQAELGSRRISSCLEFQSVNPKPKATSSMGVGEAVDPTSSRRRGPPWRRWGPLLLPLFFIGTTIAVVTAAAPLPFKRPPPDQRAFRSPAVDNYLDTVYPRFKVSQSVGWTECGVVDCLSGMGSIWGWTSLTYEHN